MMRSTHTRERLMGLLSPAVVLLLWEVLADFRWIDPRFFPPPSSIAGALVKLSRSGELWNNLSASLGRLFWGYLLGGVPALLLGLAMGLYRPVRAALDPLVAATYPIPKSAILPLVLLICGLGEASKITMVALGVFYPMIINTTAGVLEIDRIYLDVGKNFGASGWQRFYTIALPGAAPLIMAGIKLGTGLGLILIAIAEMMGAHNGIGFLIWNAWQLMAVDTMFVGLLVIALLGFAFSWTLDEIGCCRGRRGAETRRSRDPPGGQWKFGVRRRRGRTTSLPVPKRRSQRAGAPRCSAAAELTGKA